MSQDAITKELAVLNTTFNARTMPYVVNSSVFGPNNSRTLILHNPTLPSPVSDGFTLTIVPSSFDDGNDWNFSLNVNGTIGQIRRFENNDRFRITSDNPITLRWWAVANVWRVVNAQVVQTTGESLADTMSQDAVTRELSDLDIKTKPLETIIDRAPTLEDNTLITGRGVRLGLSEVVTDIEKLKGEANGIASLDQSGRVPLSQMNDAILGQLVHAGELNAATHTATLTTNGRTMLQTALTQVQLSTQQMGQFGSQNNQGNYFIVQTAGTFAGVSFDIGDWLVANANGWGKISNTCRVTSVNGRTGVVSITPANIGAVATESHNHAVNIINQKINDDVNSLNQRINAEQLRLNGAINSASTDRAVLHAVRDNVTNFSALAIDSHVAATRAEQAANLANVSTQAGSIAISALGALVQNDRGRLDTVESGLIASNTRISELATQERLHNPLTGRRASLQRILYALAGLVQPQMAAFDLDVLGLTADNFNALGITAYDIDTNGGQILDSV
jgi:hypothetical protein